MYQYWGAEIGPLTVYVYPEKEELLAAYAADFTADCTSGLLVFRPSDCATVLGGLSQPGRFPANPSHVATAASATAAGGALLVLQRPWATLRHEARLEQIIHSSIHASQSYWAEGPSQPIWLFEGGAVYATARIMAANGEAVSVPFASNTGDYEAARRDAIRVAIGMVVGLSDLEDPDRVRQDTALYQAAHVVGFLASEYLASRYGEATIIGYWKVYRDALRARLSWPQGFQNTFGLSLKDFYEQFELYRATR